MLVHVLDFIDLHSCCDRACVRFLFWTGYFPLIGRIRDSLICVRSVNVQQLNKIKIVFLLQKKKVLDSCL